MSGVMHNASSQTEIMREFASISDATSAGASKIAGRNVFVLSKKDHHQSDSILAVDLILDQTASRSS